MVQWAGGSFPGFDRYSVMLKLPFVCSLLTRNVMTLPMYQREFSMYRPCTKGSREAVLFLLILSPCPASPAVYGFPLPERIPVLVPGIEFVPLLLKMTQGR